jgi:type II secretory pathway pseudopilin PulG
LELLIVLGIVAVLAALLLPVFVSAKAASERVTCVTHQHVISEAGLLYSNDYDDRFTITNQNTQLPRTSRNDHTWVQLLLPYNNHFGSFRCPSDDGRRDLDSLMFDQDLVPGDLTSRYYTASMRSDAGLNYLALAPQVQVGGIWINMPRSYAEIGAPGTTLMLVDSAWAVDSEGHPYGGGNWLVDPPCRYLNTGGKRRDIFAVPEYPNNPVMTVNNGWTPASTTPYGGAWPWHQGRMNVTRVDGSLTSITPQGLAEGCDLVDNEAQVKEDGTYIWSAVPLTQ